MTKALNHVHRYIPSTNPMNNETLLLLHGTAGNEDSLLPVAHIILPESSVLSPRGNVLENGMPRFFKRHSEGVFDLDDLRARSADLAVFIRDAARIYNIESNEFIAAGYSNGANIASSVIFSYPGLISKAALFHPMIPFVPETEPDLSNLQVLITAGTNDPIVTKQETQDLSDMYERFGARVSIFWHDMGHSLTREELYRTKAFLSES